MATVIENPTPTAVTSTSPSLNDQRQTDINSNNNTNQTKMTIKPVHDEGMCMCEKKIIGSFIFSGKKIFDRLMEQLPLSIIFLRKKIP